MTPEERKQYEVNDWKRIYRSLTDPDEIQRSSREMKKQQRTEQKRKDTGL